MKENKRGVSPVIATVLLIAMVVVIGLIVFLWFRGMVIEGGEKFGKSLKLNCLDVNFEASYSGGILSIKNIAIPIYRMKLRIFEKGSYETEDLIDLYPEKWPELGLGEAGIFSENINSRIKDANKIILIPVLMGSKEKIYMCEEQYGQEITIE